MLEEKLRDEIIESQRAQGNMAKWKLILIAAIAATALGVVSKTADTRHAGVLALLPLVCMYVDVLCYHSGARVLTIARFFRTRLPPSADEESPFTAYEWFIQKHRRRFAIEGIAMLGVTIVSSAIVLLVGRSDDTRRLLGLPELTGEQRMLFAISGAAGLLLSTLFYGLHRVEMYGLDHANAGVPASQVWREYWTRWRRDDLSVLRRKLEAELPGWVHRCEAPFSGSLTLDPASFDCSQRQLALLGAALKFANMTGRNVVVLRPPASPTEDIE